MAFVEEFGKYCGEARVTPQASQVIVDFLVCNGGTGMFDQAWIQHWLHCGKDSCTDIWSGPKLSISRTYNATTSAEYQVTKLEQPNRDLVQLTIERFGITDVPAGAVFEPVMAKRLVGPNTREIYRWNGRVYQLSSREQISPGLEITREFDQETEEVINFVWDELEKLYTRTDGQVDFDKVDADSVTFWGRPAPDSTSDSMWEEERYLPEAASRNGSVGDMVAGVIGSKDHDRCWLTVHRFISHHPNPVGQVELRCIPNLTRLAWTDIDRDSHDELLLLTIANEDNDEPGLERLRIYRADKELQEIAKVDGAINGADGVGIKWENTQEGFKVYAGLAPDRSCEQLSCFFLDRRFKTYRWDTKSNSLLAEP